MVDNIIDSIMCCEDENEAAGLIDSLRSEEELMEAACSYNWDSGFMIPKAIVSSGKCTLAVALQVFFDGDGYSYLCDKNADSDLPEWSDFISGLYEAILEGKYEKGNLTFDIPLTKVQKYKLSKTLEDRDLIFLTGI